MHLQEAPWALIEDEDHSLDDIREGCRDRDPSGNRLRG
jgi:hypothetical protein